MSKNFGPEFHDKAMNVEVFYMSSELDPGFQDHVVDVALLVRNSLADNVRLRKSDIMIISSGKVNPCFF